MEGHLLMSRKELERKGKFELVRSGVLTLREASELLGVSYRQAKRSYKRWKEQGDHGLVHRSRGKPSGRGIAIRTRKAIEKRCKERYLPMEMGPTLMAEKLEEDGFHVDHETLRRWLLQEGLWKKRRKGVSHRSRRERRHRFGELLQLDGSHHRWFGEERPQCCLMNLVDDATGHTMALLDEEETTEAAMRLVWRWVETHGIPRALYTDRKSVFVTDREPTLEEQLAGEEPRTAFGRACAKLGIEIIEANSPQAKGRVERKHAVFQDRFHKELQLRRVTTIETANKVLSNGFVEQLNTKFSCPAICSDDAHLSVPKGVRLEDVFAFEDFRTLTNDWTLRHDNRCYQVLRTNSPLPKPKTRILVRRRLDGTIVLEYRGKPLEHREVPLLEFLPKRHAPTASKPKPTTRTSPSPVKSRSPWKQGCILMCADSARKKP